MRRPLSPALREPDGGVPAVTDLFIVTGLAGTSQYGDLTHEHVGKIVRKWRRCMNQDTTICEELDTGDRIYVCNDAFAPYHPPKESSP